MIESASGQSSAVAEAVSECEHLLGYDTVARLSDTQLGELYDLEVETMNCLTALGFEVTLPSRQAFIDQYYRGEFQLLETQVFDQVESEEQHNTAMGKCPRASSIYDPYVGSD